MHYCAYKDKLRSLLNCESGAALIEFPVCIIVLALLIFGGVEITRYMLIIDKLQKAADAETNIITSINPLSTTLTQSEMDGIVNAGFTQMLNPYISNANSILILTDIYADPNPPASSNVQPGTPMIEWRYCSGTTSASQSFFPGTPGNPTNIGQLSAPGNRFTLNSGDEIITAEVIYNFTPIISNVLAGNFIVKRTLHPMSLSAPRFGPLVNIIGANSTIPSNCQ